MRGGALGMLAFGAAALGGVALGWVAERRAVGSGAQSDDPEWAELHRRLPSQVHRVESFDGTHLHAEVTGPERAPTIVLAHGYGLSLHAWHHQRRDLSDEYRVVAYDQRGHARSEQAASGDYAISALGRDLAAVLDALVPDGRRAVVVGHSMGGMGLLAFVDGYPELVEERLAGAVLVDTTGSDVLAGAVVSTGIAALSVLERQVVDRAFRLLGRGSRAAVGNDLSFLLTRAFGLSKGASPATVAFTEELLIACPTGVKAALGPTLTGLDLAAAAPLLTVPAVVLVGADDRLTPVAAARRLADALPLAGPLVVLPGAGHMAPLEAHERVTAAIRALARRALAAQAA